MKENIAKGRNKIEAMVQTNVKQKEYYEDKDQANLKTKGNLITQFWRYLRRSQIHFKEQIGFNRYILELHLEWLGDISDKSVLDLGCYEGNELSMHIASNSKSYLGVDLSENAISVLKKKINHIESARAESVDFLSSEFNEKSKEKFDIIYAHSVLHHFEHFDEALQVCHSQLKKGGRIISMDPLKTYLPLKFLRGLYRPFQSDKDWEFPFDKKELRLIQKYFEVRNIQGVMGKAKRAVFLYIFDKNYGIKKGKEFAKDDKKNTVKISKHLYNCLQVTMNLEKKENIT